MIAADDLSYVADLCERRAGLRVDVEKAYLLESRLAPVARREGYDSPGDFVQTLRLRGDERMGWAAVEAMILPEPEFFRDRAVLEQIVEDLLPALARGRSGEQVRVWSAGCGAGQEIYSLAMMLAETPSLSQRVELLGSDLSERCLEKAQAGIYSQFEVQRGLPARVLVRHFEKIGDAFALSPRIRQMVRWRRVNLIDDLSRAGQFDLVLCRSLLGQLAPGARERVLTQFRRALAPGGRLVLALRDEPTPGFVRLAPGVFTRDVEAARSAA